MGLCGRIHRWFRPTHREVILLSQLRIPKHWIGEVVEVKFLDHAEINGASHLSPVYVVAFGRLTTIETESIVLVSWKADATDNDKLFCILRSTITSITRLERKECKHVR